MTKHELKGAEERVEKYLIERPKMRQLDKEVIHCIHGGDDDREAYLTVSDLRTILAALPQGDELERLREALRRIASGLPETRAVHRLTEAQQIARAALSPSDQSDRIGRVMVHSASLHTQSATDMSVFASAGSGWKPGGERVLAALRDLTRAERRHVEAGYVGEATSATIRSLQCKAMFFLFIDSPNGRCGFLKLTPLGESVRATIKARAASSVGIGNADEPNQSDRTSGEER